MQCGKKERRVGLGIIRGSFTRCRQGFGCAELAMWARRPPTGCVSVQLDSEEAPLQAAAAAAAGAGSGPV
jgi:hypothetical protein